MAAVLALFLLCCGIAGGALIGYALARSRNPQAEVYSAMREELVAASKAAKRGQDGAADEHRKNYEMLRGSLDPKALR